MRKEIFLALVQDKFINGLNWYEVLGKSESKQKKYLASLIGEFVCAIVMRLNEDDECFLLTSREGPSWGAIKLTTSTDENECISECLKKIKSIPSNEIFDEGSMSVRIGFMTKGSDHWDYDFLKLSGHTSGTIVIFGHHPKYKSIARQIYDNGDFDTGIEVADGEEDSYLADSALEPYDLPETLFDEEFYS